MWFFCFVSLLKKTKRGGGGKKKGGWGWWWRKYENYAQRDRASKDGDDLDTMYDDSWPRLN